VVTIIMIPITSYPTQVNFLRHHLQTTQRLVYEEKSSCFVPRGSNLRYFGNSINQSDFHRFPLDWVAGDRAYQSLRSLTLYHQHGKVHSYKSFAALHPSSSGLNSSIAACRVDSFEGQQACWRTLHQNRFNLNATDC
jgi:hypothetical protein